MFANQDTSAAFLIDADNLSPDSIDEAMRQLEDLGSVTVRRAYGGLEKLAGIRDVLRRHSIQGFVNQGRGTTDVALVVDAMELLHRGVLPGTVAIGSSDSDFSPLAVRLREAGIRVICFAQRDKAAEALPRAYDKVIYVDHAALGVASTERPLLPAVIEKSSKPENRILNDALPNLVPNARGQASKKPLGSGNAVAIEDHVAVKRILAELPGWLPNTIRQLNQLGAPLRESGIKKGHSPLYELFRKHPTFFKVLPTDGAPKQVRLLKTPK